MTNQEDYEGVEVPTPEEAGKAHADFVAKHSAFLSGIKPSVSHLTTETWDTVCRDSRFLRAFNCAVDRDGWASIDALRSTIKLILEEHEEAFKMLLPKL